MIKHLFCIAASSYLVATVAFLGAWLFRPRLLVRFAYLGTVFGLVVHSLGLFFRLRENAYPYIISNQEAYLLVAWGLVTSYVLLCRFYRIRLAGAFFMPIAVSLMVFSLTGGGSYQIDVGGMNPWVIIHLLLAFLAFAVFLASFVIGLTYIFLESRIKAKRLNGVVRRLPSLEVMDGLHYKALALGLILLTVSIVAGTVLNKVALGVFFTWDLKQIWVLTTWILYAVFLEARIRIGWRGRRGIFLSVLGFAVIILVFLGIQHGSGY